MSNKRRIENLRKQAAELEAELKQFETQYQMGYEDFYRRFKNG